MLWSPSLVGHWPLENTALDASGSGNDGTVFGGAAYAAGRLGRCLSFDGTGLQYVDCGASIALPGNMTICAWLKSTRTGLPYQYIMGKGNYNESIALGFPSANSFYGVWGGALVVSGSAILSTNVWYHVALTRSGSSGNWTAKLYVNGIEDGSANVATNPLPGAETVILGDSGNRLQPWNGAGDEFCIFTRALMGADIRRVMMGMQPIA